MNTKVVGPESLENSNSLKEFMQPIFGFILYFAALCIVSIVAGKRGLRWWAYALACLVLGPVAVMITGAGGGSGVGAAMAGFAVPVVALVVALASDTSQRQAVLSGEAGEYKKCPFCAEAVRREALKCKHCGSELKATP